MGVFRQVRSWPRKRISALFLLFVGLACGPGPRSPSVVVITLDTTRVDALGVYQGLGSTPVLDAFAERATRFEQAFTTAPYTGPSHASLMTGQNPPRHGLRDYLEQALPESAMTLAEILGARGYQTAAFVSTYVLDPRFGLDQGFDLYSSPERNSPKRQHWRPGPETVGEALEWLAGHQAQGPFLLWVHLYDAHGPYVPPERHREPLPRGIKPGSHDAQRQRYYEQLSVLDEQVGRVLDALPHPDSTLVVIAADHGELLGEHGRRFGAHSHALVDATLRVPLLIRIPGELPVGTQERSVSLIDVFPSLLQALGIPVPEDVEGKSVLEPRESSVPVYSETFYEFFGRSADGKEMASLRDGRFAFVSRAGRDELFDVRADPAERRDVSTEHPEDLERLQRKLAELRRGWSIGTSVRYLDLDGEAREDHEARLRALGYVE